VFPKYDSPLAFDFHLEGEVLIMFKAVLEIKEYNESDIVLSLKHITCTLGFWQ
jgi:hypothetical protein